MKSTLLRFIICLLPVSMACVAGGQTPAAPSTDQPAAQPQTLSKQVASDCYNRRRLAIRAVNLKYIALTQDAANLFTKESNQTRTDDANTWIKNLVWANDANLKGIAPDVKDRLGELQAAYLKERVNAIITADKAGIDDVEAAIQKATQDGDQPSAIELAKQESRIKQELTSVQLANVQDLIKEELIPANAADTAPTRPAVAAQPAVAPKPAAPSIPVDQVMAGFNKARSDAVKIVNEKYAREAKMSADMLHDDGKQSRADDADAWAKNLDSTGDAENLKNLAPGMSDQLGSLQSSYIKERAGVLLLVDRAWYEKVKAAQAQTVPETGRSDAVALRQIMVVMCKELGLAAPPPLAVPAAPAAITENPPANPQPRSGGQTDINHPFGVTADKLPPPQ